MSQTAPAAPTPAPAHSFGFVLSSAFSNANRAGLAGLLRSSGMTFITMELQITALYWIRAIINHQYKYGGTSIKETLDKLLKEGGVPRLYSGLQVALIHGPIALWFNASAHAFVSTLITYSSFTKNLPVFVRSVISSFGTGILRTVLYPFMTVNACLQAEGQKAGLELINKKIQSRGALSLFDGVLANSAGKFVIQFPWFLTYNLLDNAIPKNNDDVRWKKVVRVGILSFIASAVSNTVANPFVVVQTIRQTSAEDISYLQIVQDLVDKEGVLQGFFGRGLPARIATDGIQAVVFSILWRLVQNH